MRFAFLLSIVMAIEPLSAEEICLRSNSIINADVRKFLDGSGSRTLTNPYYPVEISGLKDETQILRILPGIPMENDLKVGGFTSGFGQGARILLNRESGPSVFINWGEKVNGKTPLVLHEPSLKILRTLGIHGNDLWLLLRSDSGEISYARAQNGVIPAFDPRNFWRRTHFSSKSYFVNDRVEPGGSVVIPFPEGVRLSSEGWDTVTDDDERNKLKDFVYENYSKKNINEAYQAAHSTIVLSHPDYLIFIKEFYPLKQAVEEISIVSDGIAVKNLTGGKRFEFSYAILFNDGRFFSSPTFHIYAGDRPDSPDVYELTKDDPIERWADGPSGPITNPSDGGTSE